MQIEINGKLETIFPSQIRGTSFESRKFWIKETAGQYPNTYECEAIQGNCNRLDAFKTGDTVTVRADVRGRAWSKAGKDYVFNQIVMLNIDLATGAKPAPSTRQQMGAIPPANAKHPDQWQAPKKSAVDDSDDPF